MKFYFSSEMDVDEHSIDPEKKRADEAPESYSWTFMYDALGEDINGQYEVWHHALATTMDSISQGGVGYADLRPGADTINEKNNFTGIITNKNI